MIQISDAAFTIRLETVQGGIPDYGPVTRPATHLNPQEGKPVRRGPSVMADCRCSFGSPVSQTPHWPIWAQRDGKSAREIWDDGLENSVRPTLAQAVLADFQQHQMKGGDREMS